MDKVLEDLGIPYDQEFEIGSGDKISSRPVFKKILEKLKDGEYDAIAVKEISRLGRGSMSDMGEIYDVITGEHNGKGIYIITPHRIYDPKNSADLRQIRFEMFFAREEFETIRERLTGARYSAAMEGKWMGKTPFGYTLNRKTVRLEPNEEEAKIVRLIFKLYTEGLDGEEMRDRAIATYLTRLGIKTPNGKDRWYPSTVERILVNNVYIGMSKFRTTKRMKNGTLIKRPKEEHILVPNAHQALIDDETFYLAQQKRNTNAPSRAKFKAPIYELTGLITCSECGNRIVVNSYTKKRKYDSVRTTFLKCMHLCNNVKYETVEEAINDFLKYLIELDDEKFYEYYKKSLSNKKEKIEVLTDEEIKRTLEEKKKSLQDRLKFIQQKHFEQVYTDEDYLMFKNEIETELERTEQLIKDTEQSNKPRNDIDKKDSKIVKKNIKDLYDLYNKLEDPAKKNRLLHRLFDDIVLKVLKAGTKQEKAQIDLQIKLKKQFWAKSIELEKIS